MLTAKLILERLDKEGRLLEKREQQSRSFIIGFLQLLYVAHAQIAEATPCSMTDITGAAREVDSESSNHASVRLTKGNLLIGGPPGPAQVYTFPGWNAAPSPEVTGLQGQFIGIQVGTGDVAVTPTDYAMSARIAHGRGAGELEYGGCELIGIAFVNPNGEFTIRRYFTNASGNPITVEEVGIYAVGTKYTPATAWTFMTARDLTGGIAVADTEILRVTYVPQITV